MYKAVFIDVDGTLIRNDHSVSEATYDIIQKLKEKNILIVLVSARPLSGILPIAEQIGLLSYPCASLNGAYISCEGNIIFNSLIDIEVAYNVHGYLKKYNATEIYYQQEYWFSEFKNYDTDHEQKITSVLVTIQPFMETLEAWKNMNTGPNKILVISEEKTINEIQDILRGKFIVELNIATSKPTFLEIMNKQASKKNALKLLMGRYNIKREEIIAIGDNFNDKEMIEFAGLGVAMGNAPDEIKAVADYVTNSNNDDGVSLALKKFIGYDI